MNLVLTHFLRSGYFDASNERGNIDKRQLYRRPANHFESDALITNKVHDINSMLLVFLDLKK